MVQDGIVDVLIARLGAAARKFKRLGEAGFPPLYGLALIDAVEWVV